MSINDVAAAKAATNYLISTGHTKMSLVNCNPAFRYSKHREKGYVQALVDAGLNINENWMIRLSSINYFLALSYIRQMLERKNRPDAIFACCDIFGMAAINAANQLGIEVPEELSIIGFDNTNTSSMTNPSLTTVAQPTAQIGSQACELLIEKIRSKSFVNQQIVLDTELDYPKLHPAEKYLKQKMFRSTVSERNIFIFQSLPQINHLCLKQIPVIRAAAHKDFKFARLGYLFIGRVKEAQRIFIQLKYHFPAFARRQFHPFKAVELLHRTGDGRCHIMDVKLDDLSSLPISGIRNVHSGGHRIRTTHAFCRAGEDFPRQSLYSLNRSRR